MLILVIILIVVANIHTLHKTDAINDDNIQLDNYFINKENPSIYENNPYSTHGQVDKISESTITVNTQTEENVNHHTFINKTIKEIKELGLSNLTGFVNITSLSLLNNTSFLNFAGAYSTSGIGLISDPYIFENIFINSSIGDILEIKDVTFYFSFNQIVILNAELVITNSNLVNLSNNFIFSKSSGIKITQVDSFLILNNFIIAEGGTKAFYGLGISNAVIDNNTIIHNIDDQIIISILEYNLINCKNITISYNKILGLGGSIFTNLYEFSSINNNYFNTSIPENSFNKNLNIRFNNAANFSNNIAEANGFLSSNIIASYSSTDITRINNNSISGFIDGIKISLVRNLEMTENQISNVQTGISLFAISNQIIKNNSITNAVEGIKFFNSNTNILNNTNLTNVNVGAVFEQSSSNILNNSQINDMNWLLYEFGTSNSNQAINSIISNYHARGLILDDNSAFFEFALANATSGDGSISTPYIFDNLLLNGGIGIFINTTYSAIFNNIIIINITSSSTTALALQNANNIKINNLVVKNSYRPLDIQYSTNITIEDAKFDTLTEGISISRGNNITINNFAMSDVRTTGIRVSQSSHINISNGDMTLIKWSTFYMDYSDNVSISNTKINSVQTGISINTLEDVIFSNNLIVDMSDTFDLDSLYNAKFVNNSFINFESDGYGYDLVNVNFTQNLFKDGDAHVLYLEDGNINIYNNYFMNITSIHPFENDDTMNWVVDGVGNYWSGLQDNATEFEAAAGEFDTAPIRPQIYNNRSMSFQKSYTENPLELVLTNNFAVPFNYTNILLNSQIISIVNWNEKTDVTHSFNIELNSGLGEYNYTLITFDKYGVKSLTEFILVSFSDDIVPSIMGPNNIVFTKGTTSNYINWTVQEAFPSEYTIYQNQIVIDNDLVPPSFQVNILLDDLNIGIYDYLINVTDTSGNSMANSVLVTVVDGSLTIPPTTSSITQSTLATDENGESNDLAWLWILLIILSIPTTLYFSARYQ